MNSFGRRQTIDRVRGNIFNLIIVALLVMGSVLIARQIKWNQLVNLFKDPGAVLNSNSTNMEPVNQRVTAGARRGRGASDGGRSNTVTDTRQMASIDSVRSMPHRIEELSLPEDAGTAVLSAEQNVVEVGSEPDRSKIAEPQEAASKEAEKDVLNVEQSESNQAIDQGYVTINSYNTARIYIDGQFSGRTPLTLKLLPGEHRIRLMAEGYEDWTRTVRLRSRQQVGIMASMKKGSSP